MAEPKSLENSFEIQKLYDYLEEKEQKLKQLCKEKSIMGKNSKSNSGLMSSPFADEFQQFLAQHKLFCKKEFMSKISKKIYTIHEDNQRQRKFELQVLMSQLERQGVIAVRETEPEPHFKKSELQFEVIFPENFQRAVVEFVRQFKKFEAKDLITLLRRSRMIK